MMGREVHLPAHLMFTTPTNTFTSYGDYVESLRSRMEKAHSIAREHLEKNTRRQKDAYDGKCVLNSFNPGDLVWYAIPTAQVHIAPKLRKSLTGPCIVVEKKNDLNYVIRLNSRKEFKLVHHNKLLPYKGDSRPTWIKNALKSLKISPQNSQ